MSLTCSYPPNLTDGPGNIGLENIAEKSRKTDCEAVKMMVFALLLAVQTQLASRQVILSALQGKLGKALYP